MADLAQLEAALVKADAAGDAEGARVLAAEVRKQRAAKPAAPSTMDRIGAAALRGLRTGSPLGIAAEMTGEGMRQQGEFIDRAAYGAGGAVTDQAAKVLPAEAAAGLGFGTNVLTQALPVVLGGRAAQAAAPVLEAGGRRLMQSALKPSLDTLKDGSAAKAITTMLDEGVNVSGGGVQKLRGMIDDLNKQITQAIASSPATLHKGKVASELYGTLKRFERQVNPNSDIKAIEAAWEEFINHPLLHGEKIPVQLAQEMKQGTYGILRDKYGQLGTASEEAQKTLARGLKEGIAEAVPNAGLWNAQESKLINALNLAERRQLMSLNKNQAGLSLLAQNPKAAAAFMADRSEMFKSLMARALYKGRERLPQAAGAGAVGTYEMGTQNQQ